MGRIYVITGTSRGLGLEMTRQLLKAGHTVYATARAPEKSKELVELRKKFPERLRLFQVDVTSDEQVAAFARELSPKTRVDVIINNAGIYLEEPDFEKLVLDDVLATLATNAVAPMRVTRALLENLRKSDNPKAIHITSLMGSIADNTSGGSYGYRMSKAALNMFHKSFALDFPEVTSLVVHPGWVQTDMGGSHAPTEPEESVRGILSLIDRVDRDDTGKFLDYEGEELPW